MESDPYKELLEEIPDFIYFHDLEGRFVDVNSAVNTLFGFEEETLIGHRVSEFIHSSFRDRFSDYLTEIVSKGESVGTMIVFDSSGENHILEYHNKLINRGGKPIGVRGVARDITEQKKMGRALKERETLYRTLFEHAEDAIFLMEGKLFIDCNPKALEMFRCRKEDIVGKPPYLFSPELQPDGRPSQEKAIEKIKAALEGTPQRFEWQHTRLDGTPFETIVSLYRIDVYKRGIIVAMVHDVSPQKEAVKALGDSEQNYREVAENANVAICRFTPEGIYTYINRYGEELFGFSREELIGKKSAIGTIIPETGPDSDKLVEMFHDIFVHPRRYYENEHKNITRDGREVYIAWRNQPIKDEDGNIREILSIGADVTRIRELERELLQAKKLEAVGTLAGGIAHDFNNILGGMTGYISLLKEQFEHRGPHYAMLEKIDEAGTKASDLVKQLLAFSRRGKYELRALDVNHRIQGLQDILLLSVPKKVEIKVALMEDLPAIKGDPSQIDQVLMNTCLNGIQAMPDGGVLNIETSLKASKDIPRGLIDRAPADFYVEISVSDTGVGMNKYTKDHIFEPFFTTKPIGEGTGLGLSTVYGIVRNHAGGIAVESKKDQGTTFRIYLPATDMHVEEQKDTHAVPGIILGKGKILVVDDEKVFRDMLKDALEYLGYEVLLAENGREGVKVFKAHQDMLDLVILDMNMPVMDGRDMFKELKKIRPDVKALLATGFTLNGEVQELMDQGVMGFIQKPFRIEEISKAVGTLMEMNP